MKAYPILSIYSSLTENNWCSHFQTFETCHSPIVMAKRAENPLWAVLKCPSHCSQAA